VIGPLEFVLVLAIVLLLFGAKRLPSAGRGLGEGLREFKHGLRQRDSAERSELPSSDKD
jgi:sec-independent protein translocase protein TatA